MEIIDVNRNTLSNLYEQFPESFKDLRLEGNNLVYAGQTVDISEFNINDLMSADNQFSSSLSVLSSEDIFRIIRVHAVTLSSQKVQNKQETLNDRLEIIKQENPLMKNISVITRNNQSGHTEFINIVDSVGRDHLFENDRNVNIFAIYDILKFQNPGRNITPDELCNEIERKLHSIQLESAETLANKSTTSEDFANKMRRVNDPYKDSKMYSVMGNQENDVAIVTDYSAPGGHRVVTFDKNEFGDVVMENHGQNVNGIDTSAVGNGTQEDVSFDNEIDSNSVTEATIKNNNEIQTMARLISSQEFYALLNSGEALTEKQRQDVDLYYAYLGDLIIYEDYLVPELRNMLNEFRAYVYDLEYGERENEINEKQQEAVNKNRELEEKKALNNETETLENAKDNTKRLELIRENSSSTGSVSTIQVIAFIVGIAIILTAVTLYLIG